MYFDLDDHRPETPRVPSAISVHAGVLLSLGAHVVVATVVLFAPMGWFEPEPPADVPPENRPMNRDSIRFVEMRPLRDRTATPRRPAEQSDMDRRSATRERAPRPENAMPFSRGNTPEKIEGADGLDRAREQPTPDPAPATAANDVGQADPMPDSQTVQPTPPAQAPAPALGQAFRNLQRYMQDGTFDNRTGGATEQDTDIQFDAMGVDFGPGLRRFKNQVERNWLLPQAFISPRERSVVIQFSVLRNGTIVELKVVQPADLETLTNSALNALRLSNPTAPLPPEYPIDRVLITVTFRYLPIRGD